MKKAESEKYVDDYTKLLQSMSRITDKIVKDIETYKGLITKGFDKLDKFNLTNSRIKKEKIPSSGKDMLKYQRELGIRLKNLYQRTVRVSSLLIKIQNILVNNISSIRVVEID